jgi:glutathione S-transferase
MYRLHCFAQSGNAFKVAFLLRALGAPYELVFVDYFAGTTRDPRWRGDVNDMGEIPVLEDGERRLTQSGAILTYLAEKYGRFGGDTEDDKLDVLRWLLFDNHKFTSYFGTYRFMKSFASAAPDQAVMAFLKGRIDGAYAIVDKYLQTHEYLVGSSPTIADFSLSGYLFYPDEETRLDWRARFPSIAAWVERLKRVPGWADPYDVLPGEQLKPRW